MSCSNCRGRGKETKFCDNCMPWTDSWLVKVDSLPDFFYADINHAYITKDNKVYVLSSDRKGWVLLNDGDGANTKLTDTELRQMFEAYKQEVANKDTELNKKLSDIDKQLGELEVKANEPKGIQGVTSTSPLVKTTTSDNNVKIDVDLSKLNINSGSNGVSVNKTTDSITVDTSKLEKTVSDLSNEVTTLKNKPDKDTVYNDTDVKKRITALESKADKFVKSVTSSKSGNRVTLTYTMSDNTQQSVDFEDKDTVSIAYDDSDVKRRLVALESKTDKDTVYDDAEIKRRLQALEKKPDKDTTYTAGSNVTISDSNVISASVPKYTINVEGSSINLTSSDGAKSTITIPSGGSNIEIEEGCNTSIKRREEGNKTIYTVSSRTKIETSPFPYEQGVRDLLVDKLIKGNKVLVADDEDAHTLDPFNYLDSFSEEERQSIYEEIVEKFPSTIIPIAYIEQPQYYANYIRGGQYMRGVTLNKIDVGSSLVERVCTSEMISFERLFNVNPINAGNIGDINGGDMAV